MKPAVWIVLLTSGMALAQQPAKVLLGVFAHPDDETLAGPVLARYAREGVKVYVAIATKGEKGTNARAGIPAGEALAKVRREEMACSCRQLGVEPPIFLEASDGELGAITNPVGRNVEALAEAIAATISKLSPDAVITGGPEGGDGHPDHRLTTAAVTQVLEGMPPRIRLYFAGFSAEQARPLARIWGTWHPTDPAYLTVRVAVSQADRQANRRAIECHRSQFSLEEARAYADALDAAWPAAAWFQPWFDTYWIGKHSSSDLFR